MSAESKSSSSSSPPSQNSSNPIPVLDVSLLDGTEEQQQVFLSQLRDSLLHLGFFYITNHGIPRELVQQMFTIAKDFFALPLEEKLQIEMVNSPHFLGYSRLGNETTKYRKDNREQLDYGSEVPARVITEDAPEYFKLVGPNQWPNAQLLPTFKPTVLHYLSLLEQLSQKLIRAVARSLGLPATYFDDLFMSPEQTNRLKIIRYPPVGSAEVEGNQGVGPHKDSLFLTILVQDQVGGLQAQIPATGEWVDATPIPDTFVINIGETLERITNRIYIATTHRVLNNESGQVRYSIPFFQGARLEAETNPIPLELLDPAVVEKAPQRIVTDVDPKNRILAIYGENWLKGRIRSHPDVTLRHYPKLANVNLSDTPLYSASSTKHTL